MLRIWYDARETSACGERADAVSYSCESMMLGYPGIAAVWLSRRQSKPFAITTRESSGAERNGKVIQVLRDDNLNGEIAVATLHSTGGPAIRHKPLPYNYGFQRSFIVTRFLGFIDRFGAGPYIAVAQRGAIAC